MTYKAVLFDIEGVLIRGAETASWIYETAANRALDDLNVQPSQSDKAVLGRFHYTQQMRSVCENLDLPVDEFWERRESYAVKLENQQVRNGDRQAFDDIETVNQLVPSHKLGIVSNNRQGTVDCVISVCNLEFMDVAIGRDHSLEGYYGRKPEPTMLVAALRFLDTSEALYVGDSLTDIVAADRAGIDSAYIRRSHNSDTDLEQAPTIEVESLVELTELITNS